MNLIIKYNLIVWFETLKPSLPFPVVISLQSNDIISGEEEGKKLLLCMYIYPLDTRKQHRMLKLM